MPDQSSHSHRQSESRHGESRHGESRHGESRHGESRQGESRHNGSRQSESRHQEPRRGESSQSQIQRSQSVHSHRPVATGDNSSLAYDKKARDALGIGNNPSITPTMARTLRRAARRDSDNAAYRGPIPDTYSSTRESTAKPGKFSNYKPTAPLESTGHGSSSRRDRSASHQPSSSHRGTERSGAGYSDLVSAYGHSSMRGSGGIHIQGGSGQPDVHMGRSGVHIGGSGIPDIRIGSSGVKIGGSGAQSGGSPLHITGHTDRVRRLDDLRHGDPGQSSSTRPRSASQNQASSSARSDRTIKPSRSNTVSNRAPSQSSHAPSQSSRAPSQSSRAPSQSSQKDKGKGREQPPSRLSAIPEYSQAVIAPRESKRAPPNMEVAVREYNTSFTDANRREGMRRYMKCSGYNIWDWIQCEDIARGPNDDRDQIIKNLPGLYLKSKNLPLKEEEVWWLIHKFYYPAEYFKFLRARAVGSSHWLPFKPERHLDAVLRIKEEDLKRFNEKFDHNYSIDMLTDCYLHCVVGDHAVVTQLPPDGKWCAKEREHTRAGHRGSHGSSSLKMFSS